MDLSSYPHLAATLAGKTTYTATFNPAFAAELDALVGKVIADYPDKPYWPDFSYPNLPAGDFQDVISFALGYKLITFEEADRLMRNLWPNATYAELIRDAWDFKPDAQEAVQLNAFKAALDAREPRQWLPNEPIVPSLLDKVEKLGLADSVTLIMLRGTLTHTEHDLPFVLEMKE